MNVNKYVLIRNVVEFLHLKNEVYPKCHFCLGGDRERSLDKVINPYIMSLQKGD